MPSINLGIQAVLKDQGTNHWRQVTRAMVINSFQLSVSVISAGGMNNQVLFVVQVMPGLPTTTGVGANYPSGGFFTESDWGPMGTDNSNKLPVDIGGWQGGGALACIILKIGDPATGFMGDPSTAPPSDSASECVSCNGLNLSVPAGSYVLAHMDHAGDALCDCEMQGVLHYA